jgi:hypothetical protein
MEEKYGRTWSLHKEIYHSPHKCNKGIANLYYSIVLFGANFPVQFSKNPKIVYNHWQIEDD